VRRNLRQHDYNDLNHCAVLRQRYDTEGWRRLTLGAKGEIYRVGLRFHQMFARQGFARWRAGPVARPGSRMAPRSPGGIAGSPAGKSPSVVKRACEGDMTAARLILERIAPLRRRHPVRLKLPEISDAVSGAARIERLQGAVPEPGQPSDAARENAAVTHGSSRSTRQSSTRSAAQGGSSSQGLAAAFPRES